MIFLGLCSSVFLMGLYDFLDLYDFSEFDLAFILRVNSLCLLLCSLCF